MQLLMAWAQRMRDAPSPYKDLPWLFALALAVGLLYLAGVPRLISDMLLGTLVLGCLLRIGWTMARSIAEKQCKRFVQRLIDAIPEPICIKDGQARILWVNQTFAKVCRCPVSELIGMNSYALATNAADKQTLISEDKAVLAGLEILKERLITVPVADIARYCQISKQLCADLSGRPLIVGVYLDATRLHQAEKGLQETLQREIAQREHVQTYMQRVIDMIPQPVFIKDVSGHYLMVNQAFCKYHMQEAEALLGKTPFDITGNPEYSRRIMMEDQQALQGTFAAKEEYVKHPLTGEDTFCYICKGICKDANGNPVIVGTNFDITAWRIAELRWKHASAAKSLFLATMSHEIRTPLSGVIGMLHLVLNGAELPQEVRSNLKIGLNSAESLLGIINDILDFSKIEAGQLQLEHATFDLHATAREIAQNFREQAQLRGLEFTLTITSCVPQYVLGDVTRLRQILINLIGNALKFTEKGSVTVAMDAEQSNDNKAKVSFQVADTGIGIPADVLPNLFQMFQQADDSTTRKFGGTGLGLAICRHMVNAMGGEITVTSIVGQGSCFAFTLELEISKAPPAEEGIPLPPHSHRLLILCAEDVRVNQLIIQAQLTNMGHEVDMVGTGLEAIRALSQKDYDLVLMDGRMPEMDGTDATRAIRAGGTPDYEVRNPAIRIVALTANASNEDREQALAAGMDDYLTKPVREAQLHAALSATIDLLEHRSSA
jgi:PAS domain S-box-containing protein